MKMFNAAGVRGLIVFAAAATTAALAAAPYVTEPDAAHAASSRRHTGIPSVAAMTCAAVTPRRTFLPSR